MYERVKVDGGGIYATVERYVRYVSLRAACGADCEPLSLTSVYLTFVHSTLFNDGEMIRREPTMIPMSDADVQDVRDLVATQTAEAQRNHRLIAQLKTVAAESTPQKDQDKDRLERERRLGIPSRATVQTTASSQAAPATQLSM